MEEPYLKISAKVQKPYCIGHSNPGCILSKQTILHWAPARMFDMVRIYLFISNQMEYYPKPEIRTTKRRQTSDIVLARNEA